MDEAAESLVRVFITKNVKLRWQVIELTACKEGDGLGLISKLWETLLIYFFSLSVRQNK
jgi:hypothetical protein